MELLNVFQAPIGIPIGVAIVGGLFHFAAKKSGKSGSTIQVGTGTPQVHVEDGKRNARNKGFLIFAYTLYIVAIGIFAYQASDYRKEKPSDKIRFEKQKEREQR